MAFEVILKDVFGGLVDPPDMRALTFVNCAYWFHYRMFPAIQNLAKVTCDVAMHFCILCLARIMDCSNETEFSFRYIGLSHGGELKKNPHFKGSHCSNAGKLHLI